MDFAVAFVLRNAYQLFLAAFIWCYGAIATPWPAYRAAGAAAASLLLLVLQPFINQAAATGLTGPLLTASWAVIYTWEMLDSGFLQRASPASVLVQVIPLAHHQRDAVSTQTTQQGSTKREGIQQRCE
jgi:hypothetical protein